jgi:hypothetical protein
VRRRGRAKRRLRDTGDGGKKRFGFLKTAGILRRVFLNQIPSERGDLDDEELVFRHVKKSHQRVI